MRDSALFGLRLTLGGYLAAHGAQKLFGSFDGPGLDKTGVGFESLGLKPGKAFAALAGGAEFAGGALTAAGALQPVGPLAVVGAMAVASLTHADKGPMLQKGGFELPATNLAAALALIFTGPGRYSFDRLIGLHLPKALTRLAVLGAIALTTYSAVQVVKAKGTAARAHNVPSATASTEAEPADAPA
ncbi:MAG: DoxX family protein [Acidimicrobiales bacterium]|jgi:putative oxidoreductase